jgi:hypothetical protein
MSTRFFYPDEQSLLKLSGWQTYYLFEKMIDLMAKLELGHREGIVNYLARFDTYYHPEVFSVSMQDDFISNPEDLGILIDLFEKAVTELAEEKSDYFKQESVERIEKFLHSVKLYHQKLTLAGE